MSPAFLQFLQRWVVTTLAVLVASWVMTGIHYDTTSTLLLASLLLGFLNAFARPLLLILSLPLLVLTLGMFTIVINALLLLFVGKLVKGFEVDGFWTAFWGGMVISLVSIVVNLMLGRGPQVQVRRGPGRPPSNRSGGPGAPGGGGPPAGAGPVIDV